MEVVNPVVRFGRAFGLPFSCIGVTPCRIIAFRAPNLESRRGTRCRAAWSGLSPYFSQGKFAADRQFGPGIGCCASSECVFALKWSAYGRTGESTEYWDRLLYRDSPLFKLMRFSLFVAFAAVGVFVLTQFGLWQTGRATLTPLALVLGGPSVSPPGRIWIDTDAACGAGPRTDPDDCFAIRWLMSRHFNIVGISTSFGNAKGEIVIDRVSALVALMGQDGLAVPPVFKGQSDPIGVPVATVAPGVAALRAALEQGPITVLALGPLTNLVAALEGRKDLQANVVRIVAVMGHRKGHLFHPAEGNGKGAMFGHGPIFRDLNFSVDPKAVRAVLAMDLPMTLIPYDAGRGVMITGADLDLLSVQGMASAWLSENSRGWLDFWNDEIGRPGFYPFDWVAAAYLSDQQVFDCVLTTAQIDREWTFWLWPRQSLVVAEPGPVGHKGKTSILYCPKTSPLLHDLLVSHP
jgi:purine nucleosidase